MSARSRAGDTHNFGQHVELRGDRVYKPRALYWEWLFLSAKSPLRKLLADVDFLPDLTFYEPRALARGGEVSRLALAPLGRVDKHELARIVGRAAALFSWFGVSDLHWENLALGRAPDGRVIFTPVDIELVLSELGSPMETQMFPAANSTYADIVRHACGVRRAIGYLGKPVAVAHALTMAAAYRAMLQSLQARAREITAVLRAQKLTQTAPIRICIRGTSDYVAAQNDLEKPLWPPLMREEREQLARGDIPYFFHRYGEPGVHEYMNQARTKTRRVVSLAGLGKTENVLSLGNALRPKSRDELLAQGTFAILAAFDHAGFTGTHDTPDVHARITARTITLTFADGETWSTKRNLGAFVSSVYLPCACGEQRAVFARAGRHRA